jgi:hypothetical protein
MTEEKDVSWFFSFPELYPMFQEISQVPDLGIAQLRFYINHPELSNETKKAKWNQLMEARCFSL